MVGYMEMKRRINLGLDLETGLAPSDVPGKQPDVAVEEVEKTDKELKKEKKAAKKLAKAEAKAAKKE